MSEQQPTLTEEKHRRAGLLFLKAQKKLKAKEREVERMSGSIRIRVLDPLREALYETDNNLLEAGIALLLVDPDFMAAVSAAESGSKTLQRVVQVLRGTSNFNQKALKMFTALVEMRQGGFDFSTVTDWESIHPTLMQTIGGIGREGTGPVAEARTAAAADAEAVKAANAALVAPLTAAASGV